MNRRELLTAALAAGAGVCFGTGRPSRTCYAATGTPLALNQDSPLALSDDVLAMLKSQAKPTRLGIGLQRPREEARRFDTVTPCNALKYRPVQRNGWGPADAIADMGLPLRVHTVLWATLQGAMPVRELEPFIREIARRYGEQIYAWDIVNEPIHIPRHLHLVPDLIKLARDLTPDADIIINEFDVIRSLPGYANACCLAEVIAFAVKVGADGVGVQAHGNRWYSRAELTQTFNEIEAAGLICHVTEAIYKSDGSRVAHGHSEVPGNYGMWTERNQALAYRDLVAVARAHPAVTSCTLWTLHDTEAWAARPNGGLIGMDGQPKEAWQTIFKEI